MSDKIVFSVFVKPWPKKSIAELGHMVHWMGFDGIELPVRPGFPVNPENAATELPKTVKTLAEHNVKIYSIAGSLTEAMIAACAAAGVPTLRVMVPVGADGYLATEEQTRKEFDAILPVLERHHVRIGVQNHCGKYICNASGLRTLVDKYDPKYVGAVWDAAHNALQGEEPELAIEIVWPHLCMVNLKNAVWRRKNAANAPIPEWAPYWTPGREGLASWTRVMAELKRRQYSGVVCLTAEYSDEAQVDNHIADDLNFARALADGA
jgi:sugar phosphate isomerase/epimerase